MIKFHSLSPRIKRCILGALLAIGGVAVYSGSFAVPLQLDDQAVIENNAHIKSGPIADLFWYDPTRFLTHLSFRWNYQWDGLNVFGFHLINLILHLFNALLVYGVMTCTLRRVRHSFSPGFVAGVPVVCAVIFFVHPIQTQAVTYIAQRSTLLAAFFYLQAVWLYLQLRENFDIRRYIAFWLVILLGSLSKPIIVTLPLMVLLYETVVTGGRLSLWRVKGRLLVPLILLLIIVPVFLFGFILHYYSMSWSQLALEYATRVTDHISRWQYFLTQGPVVLKYAQLLLWPFEQNFDYDFPLSVNLLEPRVIAAFWVLLLAVTAAVFYRNRIPFITIAVGWLLVPLVLESSFFPLPDVINEHRLYLSMVGFALLLCLALSRWPREWTSVSLGVVAALTVFYSTLTYARNLIWQDRGGFLQDIISKSPRKARPRLQLGHYYLSRQAYALARAEYETALRMDPGDPEPAAALARLYLSTGKTDRAKEFYAQTLSLRPERWEDAFTLAQLYYTDHQEAEAEKFLHHALKFRPKFLPAWLSLADLYESRHDFEAAQGCYQAVLQMYPSSGPLRVQGGDFYFRQNRMAQAMRLYEDAIQIDSRNFSAYNNLGLVHYKSGDLARAEIYLRKAFELQPDSSSVCRSLSFIYKKLGRLNEAERFAQQAQRQAVGEYVVKPGSSSSD